MRDRGGECEKIFLKVFVPFGVKTTPTQLTLLPMPLTNGGDESAAELLGHLETQDTTSQ